MSKLLALLSVVSFVGFNSLAATDHEAHKDKTEKADHKDHADKKDKADHKDAKHADKHADKKEAKHADHKATKTKKADDTAETPATFKDLDKDAAKAKFDEDKVLFVDARKVAKGDYIIKGALVISADAEDKEIAKMLKDKDAEIIVYCGNVKCPASSTLGFRLIELGYKNVSHYRGGIDEWKESELPTDKYQG
jgi:rhodanese-related sulfurtransferase